MSEKKYQIKRLSSKDFNSYNHLFEQIDIIHRKAHPEYFRKPVSLLRTKDYFESLLSDTSVLLIGAFIESDKLIGLAHACQKESPTTTIHVPRKFVLLDNLVVDESHRGNGVGKSLYNDVTLWTKENNLEEIQLKVYSFNKEAIAFYESNGFSEFNISMRSHIE